MGIGRFLNHRVTINRAVVTFDGPDVVLDDHGQPVVTDTVIATVAAGIQPKSARELAQLNQAGVASSTHSIYLLPTDVSTADRIVHVASACPLTVDLPDGTYQVIGVPDAAGAGHHLELDAQLVGATQSALAPVGS
jgi:head-tail adaptor